MTVLLATTYFGPVQWYQKLYRAEAAVIDADESFQKQTYRNRCVIAAANDPQSLVVPVEKARRVRDVRISDHGNWRHQHWHALLSAYGDSPFFDYYQDDLRPFFEEHWEYLYDYNMAIVRKMCELLDIQPRLVEGPDTEVAVTDWRTAIHPKHPLPDADFLPRRYYQVYEQRHGFLSNLSILDLLLNMGPESIFFL